MSMRRPRLLAAWWTSSGYRTKNHNWRLSSKVNGLNILIIHKKALH